MAYSVVSSAPHSGLRAHRVASRPPGRPLRWSVSSPNPEARAAPPYPRPAASGELPRMGKRRTVGRVSTGQFALSLRGVRVYAE